MHNLWSSEHNKGKATLSLSTFTFTLCEKRSPEKAGSIHKDGIWSLYWTLFLRNLFGVYCLCGCSTVVFLLYRAHIFILITRSGAKGKKKDLLLNTATWKIGTWTEVFYLALDVQVHIVCYRCWWRCCVWVVGRETKWPGWSTDGADMMWILDLHLSLYAEAECLILTQAGAALFVCSSSSLYGWYADSRTLWS